MTSCSMLDSDQRFGSNCCLYFHCILWKVETHAFKRLHAVCETVLCQNPDKTQYVFLPQAKPQVSIIYVVVSGNTARLLGNNGAIFWGFYKPITKIKLCKEFSYQSKYYVIYLKTAILCVLHSKFHTYKVKIYFILKLFWSNLLVIPRF